MTSLADRIRNGKRSVLTCSCRVSVIRAWVTVRVGLEYKSCCVIMFTRTFSNEELTLYSPFSFPFLRTGISPSWAEIGRSCQQNRLNII